MTAQLHHMLWKEQHCLSVHPASHSWTSLSLISPLLSHIYSMGEVAAFMYFLLPWRSSLSILICWNDLYWQILLSEFLNTSILNLHNTILWIFSPEFYIKLCKLYFMQPRLRKCYLQASVLPAPIALIPYWSPGDSFNTFLTSSVINLHYKSKLLPRHK